MLDAFSSALSGLSAATRRLEASANAIANSKAQGAAPGDPAGRQANQPVRVEQTSAPGQGGAIATFRGTTPAYLAVLNPQGANTGLDGFAAGPDADLAGETVEQIDASASFEASAKTIQAVSDLVKKVYDLV